MRQLPHRRAKDFAFCFKCNQPHKLPVGRLCQAFGQISGNNMAETASNSSTSSIPLGQTAVESPPRSEILSHVPNAGPPDKLDAILQHLNLKDQGSEEVTAAGAYGRVQAAFFPT